MIAIAKPSHRRRILITVTSIVSWCAAAWFISERYYLSRTHALIERETTLSQERASDLADSIRRNLSYLHGIPDLFSHHLRIRAAVARFGADAAASTLLLEARRKRWTADPVLNDLNQYLVLAQKSLNVDNLFVLDAAGDAIAASNWNSAQSTVGTNFADRAFTANAVKGEAELCFAAGMDDCLTKPVQLRILKAMLQKWISE
jgi:C4-dicarboxylate-specific signal transduction histidine kinase